MEDVREISLTRGKVAIVDASDYDFLMQWRWFAHRGRNGTWRAARKSRCRPKKKHWITYMHRVIMNAPKGIKVDHRDGDGLHNWRGNLRLATNQQNLCNRGPNSNNTSGHKGVSLCAKTNKWKASISFQGKEIWLGRFADKTAAAAAYADAAKKYHGDFARTEPFTRGEAA